jgi:hypothetical protein
MTMRIFVVFSIILTSQARYRGFESHHPLLQVNPDKAPSYLTKNKGVSFVNARLSKPIVLVNLRGNPEIYLL